MLIRRKSIFESLKALLTFCLFFSFVFSFLLFPLLHFFFLFFFISFLFFVFSSSLSSYCSSLFYSSSFFFFFSNVFCFYTISFPFLFDFYGDFIFFSIKRLSISNVTMKMRMTYFEFAFKKLIKFILIEAGIKKIII